MREGVLLDAVSIPLEANGQTSWFIDQAFPAADTSDFAGSVLTRVVQVVPPSVVPVPEMPSQE